MKQINVHLQFLIFVALKKFLFNPLIQITSLLREPINSCLVLGWHNGQFGPGEEKSPVNNLNYTSGEVPTADLLFQKDQGGNGVYGCSESSAGDSDRQPGMRASASLVGMLPDLPPLLQSPQLLLISCCVRFKCDHLMCRAFQNLV